MALKIRLARGGAKKRPFYRIIVAEANCPRDGRFLEKLGTYNPLLANDHKDRIVLRAERIQYWLSTGALPTDRVALFLADAGLIEKKQRPANPMKSAPKKRAQERMKAEEAAQAAAEEKMATAQPSQATQNVSEDTGELKGSKSPDTPGPVIEPPLPVTPPVPEEIPAVEEPPVVPHTPEETPVTDEPPALSPVPEEVPAVEEPPVDLHTPDETPVIDEPPALSPVPEEIPVIEGSHEQ